MRLRTRFGVTIATATLGVLGMAACSPSQPSTATMSAEATALTALGFADTDVAGDAASAADAGSGGAANGPVDATAAATSNSSAAPRKARHPGLRRLLIRRATVAKHLEHGTVTVATKDGQTTVDVQRGTITAITSTSMTVRSADGFTLTWTFGDKMRVIENRATIESSGVKTGETVGVAGEKTGSTDTARLVVIPKQGSSK